jgi:hypothetical protein
MIEGNYRIDFYYDEVNTGYVIGQYTTPDNGYGLEKLTVDEYSIGSIDEFIVTSDTNIYTRDAYNPSLAQWLVAIASVKTDIVFKATKVNFKSLSFNDNLLIHVDDSITVRLSVDEITYKWNNRIHSSSDNYKDIIIIFDCEKFISNTYEFAYGLRIILTDRLQYIKYTGGFFGSVGIYNLSNLKYIGGGTFLRSSFFIVDKDTLPNETVYNFEPTIVEGEYEGIQVLKKWALIKFADDCVIETGGFSGGVEDHTMFDLCNISNRSGKEAFSIGGSEVLIKIKNTLRTDFFGIIHHMIYAYCEDEEFLRNMRDGDGRPLSDMLIRPKKFVVQAVRPNNWYDNLVYNLKYTPNINTGMTLCCDVNCLEYGVGHYTAEMTDDLNIDHKTLCVGYDKTNKYYRIKEEQQ